MKNGYWIRNVTEGSDIALKSEKATVILGPLECDYVTVDEVGRLHDVFPGPLEPPR